MPLRRTRCAAAVAAAALLLCGCGNPSADEVRNVATAFAGDGDDPSARCDLLAPATLASLLQQQTSPCPEVIQGLPLGSGKVMQVEVWGEEAQAKLADDTLFLTRTSAGWRVMAAACTPKGGHQPYDCQLESS